MREAIALLLLEIVLRMFVGHFKPMTFGHVPPGAIGNCATLVLASAMLAVALVTGRRTIAAEDR
jgi:hypothetical protein